jgi:hypothetical protein
VADVVTGPDRDRHGAVVFTDETAEHSTAP